MLMERMMRQTLTPNNVARLTPVASVRVGWITSAVWSPDGQTIAVAGGTQTYVYDRSFGATPTYILDGHDGPVKDVAINRDNDLLAAVGADCRALVWSIDGAPRQVNNYLADDALTCVTFSTDGRRLIAGGASGGIFIWDLRDDSLMKLPYPHSGEVAAVTWRMSCVFSAGRDGEMLCHDMTDVRAAPVVTAAQSEWIRDFDLSTDCRIAYTVSRDGTLRGWTREGDMLFRVMAHEGGADSVAAHHSGSLIATGGRDHSIRLWDVDSLLTGRPTLPVAMLTAHTKPVLTLAFNRQGTLLLTGSGDNTVRLWSVEERNDGGN
jgi:WD40 repeat protein